MNDHSVPLITCPRFPTETKVVLYTLILWVLAGFGASIYAKTSDTVRLFMIADSPGSGTTIRYGYISRNGELALKVQCEQEGDFSEGLAAVQIDGRWGFIDTRGKLVVAPRFDTVGEFHEGLALFSMWPPENPTEPAKYGYIDPGGVVVIPPRYRGGGPFAHGRAAVSKGIPGFSEVWGFVDKEGREVVPLEYERVENYSEGAALCYRREVQNRLFRKPVQIDDWLFIDLNGREINGELYQDARSFSEGRACVKLNSKWGYINREGHLVIECIYDAARDFSYGLAAVQDGRGDWGFIDTAGKKVIASGFVEVKEFSRNSAFVKDDSGLWGIVDRSGRYVRKPEFEDAIGFTEGYGFVMRERKWAIIDTRGKLITPFRFTVPFGEPSKVIETSWLKFRNGLAMVKIDGAWGYVNRDGIVVWKSK